MTPERGIHSDLPIPPGEYLEEVVEALGMTKGELARRMVRPASKLSPIFKGTKAITPDTALQLEKVVGVPAHVWLGLEAEYRLTLARRQEAAEEKRLKREVGLLQPFRYADLVKAKAVAKRTKPVEKVRELQLFFGVASLTAVPEVRRYQHAFRQCASRKRGRSPEALAAWLRLGEQRGRGIACGPFNKAGLRQALDDIRVMTQQVPKVFLRRLGDVLAKAGVAPVLCAPFAGAEAHGATFWLLRDKAVLMLSTSGPWADVFWFRLFHGLGHILLHSRNEVIVEGEHPDHSGQDREESADRFAWDALIPPVAYRSFAAAGKYRPDSIRAFAKQIGIDPGIVVGRLHDEKRLDQAWCNELRTRYVWPKEVA
jgi:HTH-type transcriptional regulator/antitoxin HigA